MRRSKRLASGLCLALVAILGVPSLVSGSSAIGLSTPKFTFNLPSGAPAHGSLVVSNEGTEELKHVLVYATNLVPDRAGKDEYVIPKRDDRFENSPALWLTVRVPDSTKIFRNTPFIALKPGQHAKVDFSLQVPQGATPGDYTSLLFFEMLPEEGVKSAATRSLIGGRLGARIRIRVLGAFVRRLSIRPFTVPRFVVGSEIPYSLAVRNDGNIDQPFDGKISVLDRNEQALKLATVDKAGYIYARSVKDYSGRLTSDDYGLGRYTVEAESNFESTIRDVPGIQIVKRRSLWVIPVWLYWIAVMLIVTLIIFFFYALGLITSAIKRRRKAHVAARASESAGVPGVEPAAAGTASVGAGSVTAEAAPAQAPAVPAGTGLGAPAPDTSEKVMVSVQALTQDEARALIDSITPREEEECFAQTETLGPETETRDTADMEPDPRDAADTASWSEIIEVASSVDGAAGEAPDARETPATKKRPAARKRPTAKKKPAARKRPTAKKKPAERTPAIETPAAKTAAKAASKAAAKAPSKATSKATSRRSEPAKKTKPRKKPRTPTAKPEDDEPTFIL